MVQEFNNNEALSELESAISGLVDTVVEVVEITDDCSVKFTFGYEGRYATTEREEILIQSFPHWTVAEVAAELQAAIDEILNDVATPLEY